MSDWQKLTSFLGFLLILWVVQQCSVGLKALERPQDQKKPRVVPNHKPSMPDGGVDLEVRNEFP